MADPPTLLIPPPAFLHDPALRAVLAALPEARLVGGCVRDALLGQRSADIDLATPFPPDQVSAALKSAGLRAVPTGLAHGTVTAVSFGRGFEVTTLRRDEETDGRHARVAWTADWRADAARRDFTFNAMSLRWAAGDASAAVFDYFGGIADLHAGQVRFVGDAATRINEDRLRVLRFFRFHARYGTTPPDESTRDALQGGVPGLAQLSVERVWSELKRILATPDPRAAVALMDELGVLNAVLPWGADPQPLYRLVASAAPPDPLLRLAALLPGDPAPLAERLKLSTAERDQLLALHAAPTPDPTMDEAALRRLLVDWPGAVLAARTWLAGGAGSDWDALRDKLARMPRPRFPLAGRDAVRLGVPAGPQVGELLRDVRAWWMAGGCVADAAACRAELAARIPR